MVREGVLLYGRMMGMRHLQTLILILLLGIGIAKAEDLPYIGKTFRSISESECNLAIQLKSDRTGVAVQTCSTEGGPGIAQRKFTFTWQAQENTIVVVSAHGTDTFQYTDSAPKSFRKMDFAPALILTTEESHGSHLGGYGGRTFWEYPSK